MFVAVFCVLTGCSKRAEEKSADDANISNKLVGVWKVDETFTNGVSARGQDSFSKDGTFKSSGVLSRGEHHMDLAFAGVWQINQGILIQTITNSSNTNLHIGFVTRDTIVKVDDQHFIFRQDDGRVVSRDRVQ